MDRIIAILIVSLIVCTTTTNSSERSWITESLVNQSSVNIDYDSRTNRSGVLKELKVIGTTSLVNESERFTRLFDIWNPALLMNTWKREPRKFRVSRKCDEDTLRFLIALENSSIWALKMLDASGRHAWGLFSGGGFWLGSSDQCREMDNDVVQLMKISNRTERDEETDFPPYRVSVNSVKLRLEIFRSRVNASYDVTLGLCLPSNCRPEDVAELLEYTSNAIPDLSRKVTISHVRNLSEGYQLTEDPIFYIILISLALTSILVVLGTLYDVALRYRVLSQEIATRRNEMVNGENVDPADDAKVTKATRPKRDFEEEITVSKLWSIKQHNGTLDLWNSKDVPKPLSEALLSFSALLNISKMASLDVGSDTLAPIHGLRFVSILWIILVHTCLMMNEVSDNKTFRLKAEEDFLYQTISNGTYAVDTFFFISGCLVSFLYFRTMSKQRIREKKITQGFIGKIMQFLGMMSYRYFRLTPPYLLVIGFVQVSTKWYHDHSILELTTLDHRTCEQFWWRNAVYLNTYFDMDERCMVWSWYLANDTQFYTVGIIILIIAASFASVGGLIGAVVLISSWITTTAIALSNGHIATIDEPFAHYESLYDKPWTRIGPYLIGMAAGWYLCRIDCKLKLSKTANFIGWIISIVTLLSIVYGLYGNRFHPVSSALYTSLSHSAWALSVGFILIACVTGNGGGVDKILSWKYVYPLSRLTYCVYLIHPALLRVIILHSENSFHFTEGLMGIIFFGIAVASYAISLFLSLLFEAPMVSLLRIAHPLRQWKRN